MKEKEIRLQLVISRYIKPNEQWKKIPCPPEVSALVVGNPLISPESLLGLVEWLNCRTVELVKVALVLRARNQREWVNASDRLRDRMTADGWERFIWNHPELETPVGYCPTTLPVNSRKRSLVYIHTKELVSLRTQVGIRLILEGGPQEIAVCVEDIFGLSKKSLEVVSV